MGKPEKCPFCGAKRLLSIDALQNKNRFAYACLSVFYKGELPGAMGRSVECFEAQIAVLERVAKAAKFGTKADLKMALAALEEKEEANKTV